MRRGSGIAAAVVGVLVVLEVAVGWLGARRASAALCGADVELGRPVTVRVLAGRPVPYEARLAAPVLEGLVPLPGPVSGLVVGDDRLGLETAAGVTVPAHVELDGDVVSVTPTLGVLDLDRLALRYDLGELLPAGVEVDRLEVAGDVVVVAGHGDRRVLTAPGGGIRCVS